MKMYKVVKESPFGGYVSCRSFTPIYYYIGQKTSPKIEGSGIFVFKNLNDVKFFISDRELLLIGEAENPRPVSLVSAVKNREFWELRNKGNYRKLRKISAKAPTGSYICDSFTPESFA